MVAVIGLTQLAQQIGVVAKQMITVGAYGLKPGLGMTDQAQLPHQAQRAITTARHAFFSQMGVPRPVTIRPRALTPYLADLWLDLFVLLAPHRWPGFSPAVVSGAGHSERFTHGCYAVTPLMSFHILEAAQVSLAK